MPTPAHSFLHRRSSGIIAVALMAAVGLLGVAAPAAAVPAPEEFTLSGNAFIDGDEPRQISARLRVDLYQAAEEGGYDVIAETFTDAVDGSYEFSGLGEGQYGVNLQSEDPFYPGVGDVFVPVSLESDVELDDIVFSAFRKLGGGAIQVTGDPAVGATLTATVGAVTGNDGQEIAADLDLNWGYGRGQSGDSIAGATGRTVVVPGEAAGATISYSGYAYAEGYRPTLLRSNGLFVSAPVEAAAPAPVADSAGLAAFLEANSVAPISAAEAGLPAEADPTKSQVVTIKWFGGDSFVDVYAYSAPRFVGTFPVVDGRVQLTLTPAVLAALGAGSHTLVYTGQSSGTVQAVAFSISPALASTGFAPTVPLGIAGGLLVFGAGLMVAKRRGKAAHKA